MRRSLSLVLVGLLACSGGQDEEQGTPESPSSVDEAGMSASAMSATTEPNGMASSTSMNATSMNATGQTQGPPDPEQAEGQPSDDGASPERRFPAFEEGTPIREPAVGQWVRYGLTWRDGARSTTQYAIVDREDGSWWVEVTDRRRGATRHVRMRVRLEGTEKEILDLSFAVRGEVQRIPPRLISTYEPLLRNWLEMLFPGPIEGEPSEVSVPAGVFEGARQSHLSFDFQNQHVEANVWRHPEAPITGMVRFEDEADGHTLELIGYGLEGAQSAF